ncbi:MAG: hypothetical protein FJ098_10235, partial [Deltaproteobacteria bacterium]|nr:hypothetical protein [Deltaproteobacteria bacterium]
PEFIHHIGDVPRLQRFASGFLTPPEEGATFEERRRPLADYYDLRYLSCAISALHGEDPLVYRPRFVEFVDTFIRTLYAVVLREEMSAASAPPVTRDLFAVFATGGYAREQAFDDDYDLLPVLNTTDPDIEALVNRAWQRVHREIVRRGTIPQYRFADHFGGFVTRLEVLEDFFRSGASDTVDEAQVLGLRLVAGSSRMTTAIAGRVVRPLVFPRADRFISRIAEDMRERHALAGPADQGVDIKDGIGGLRDVEQILLVLNIRYQVMEPVTPRLYEMLAVVAEGHADELSVLARRHRFLREVRDLYRLTVAASDEILREHLAPVDAILRARGLELPDGPDGLFDVLLDSMEQVRAACRAILQDLGCGSCP